MQGQRGYKRWHRLGLAMWQEWGLTDSCLGKGSDVTRLTIDVFVDRNRSDIV